MCLSKIPEIINMPFSFKHFFKSEAIITKTSATIFAITTSYFFVVLFVEPIHESLNDTPFKSKFAFVSITQTSSVSQISTIHPFFAAAIAKIPLPVPTSKTVWLEVTNSSIASIQEDVVSWCPEPKDKAGLIIISIFPSFFSSQDGLI